MLSQFTWQQFIVTLLVLVLVYYLVVFLFFFRNELFKILRHLGRPFQQADLDEVDEHTQGSFNEENRYPHFEDSEASPEPDLLIGTVSDLLQEFKSLTDVIRENESSREETVSFFRMLLSRYAQLIGTTYQTSISSTMVKIIGEELKLSFTLQEILSWWQSSTRNN